MEQISKNYRKSDGLIDIFTECFLISCKSITDYIIMDYFENNFKSMSMVRRNYLKTLSKINLEKELEDSEKPFLGFLTEFRTEYKKFEKIPLVAYFFTLRHILVHYIVPHIFENQYQGRGAEQKVISRRFQRDFQDYLLKEDGGGILLESGFHLLLESSGKDSFFDIKPLRAINENEKNQLKKRLENDEPIKLMKEFLDQLSKFISKFET